MLAHYHGQIWNASEIGRSLGLTDKTVRRYLDILTATYMVRQVYPWHENIVKRQVKSPKIYLRDSGLLHSLLSIPNKSVLWGHPKIGASWEGFMLEQILRMVTTGDAYFWATHSGAEIDLLVMAGGKRYGIEFKRSEQPTLTKSMQAAKQDLALEKIWVVYPGPNSYQLEKEVAVVSSDNLPEIISVLGG